MKYYYEDYERALMSENPVKRLKSMTEKELSWGNPKSEILSFYKKLIAVWRETNREEKEVHSIAEIIEWIEEI